MGIDFKKGFNVMSSLTRRSAMSVSKSMQNLSIESKKEADQSKKQLDDANHALIPTSDVIQAEKKMETEDPLYANIAPATPKRNSIRQSKKINKEGSEEGCLMEVQKGQQQQQKQKSSRTGGESSAAKKLLQSAIQEDND